MKTQIQTIAPVCLLAFLAGCAQESPAPRPTSAALPPEIKSFIAAKEQAARSLAAKVNAKLPRDVADYFRAAQAGNWQQASNTFAGASRRLYDAPPVENSAALQAVRQPMIETHIALEYYTQAQPKYATAFGRDIIASIPAGSIYFGGTDPGRGLVTALSKSHTEGDPFFTITQNALADASYLDYVRQMYGPRIYVPTPEDYQSAFQAYLSDAQQRLEHDQKFPNEPKQIRPGEEIKIVGGRVQVSGQVAVMSINALLARTIFENNAQREFYVEQSFPLEWMYPHLEPHGLILKLNRAPLDQIPSAAVKRDAEFWSARMKPMVGDWLKEDTAVSEVCDFIERVFVRKDLKGFTGDPAFVGDPYSCKAFSKLRSSIAGVYHWRGVGAKDDAERKRMNRAADFAFRQALALCPYSPEVVERYVRALADDGRMADALRVAQVAVKFPETKAQAEQLIKELTSRKN